MESFVKLFIALMVAMNFHFDEVILFHMWSWNCLPFWITWAHSRF